MRRLMASLWIPILAASLLAAACAPSSGTEPAGAESAATPAEPAAAPAAEGAAPVIPVPTDLVVETAIPGVVAAGTPIQLIKAGFEGAEGPVGMPDGSVLFTETRASRITRIAPDGQHLGTIRVVWGEKEYALRKPANLACAGRDKKTLYVFGAGGSAFRIQMLAQGFMGRAK
jgi:sugar lactone lactonase YvrE